MIFPNYSQVTIAGHAYNMKLLQTKTGKDGLRLGLRYYDNKLTTFINVTYFGPEAQDLMDALIKGQAVTVFGRVTLDEWETKMSIGIAANKILLNFDDRTRSQKAIETEDDYGVPD
jgi:single-stranded DNA-binding protein